MSNGEDVNIFTIVSSDTHTRLSVLAARYGISKAELYRQALAWACRRRKFQDTMGKVYVSHKDR